MHPTVRRLAALFGATLILTLAAPAAGASTRLHVEELRVPRGALDARTGALANLAPNACTDPAFTLEGVSQAGAYSWSFNAASTPFYLSQTAVRDVLIRSFSNITRASNDCGLPDNVSATHNYLGTTSTKAKCGRRDSRNVVGFGALSSGTLAVTCYWTKGNRIVEADMQINSRERWALSVASCFDEELLEPTITHEAGHVFGLDHVGERRHGRLTMSTIGDGLCDNEESSLGLGDVRAMEALY
jgi:hypothetical protein